MGHETNTGDLLKQGFGEHTECNARGSLTGTRALKDGASLGQVVGQHAGKVRVTGTGPRQRTITSDFAFVSRSRVDEKLRRINRIGTHHRLPLGPLRVANANSHRGAGCHAVTHTGQD